MKLNNWRTRLLFSLLMLGCFIGGAYLSVYSRAKSEKGAGSINHDGAAANSTGNPAAVSPGAADLFEVRRIAALTRTMERARDIGLNMNAPLEFYGQVIDQHGKPVPGVSATLKYNYFNAVVLAAYDAHNAEEKRVTDQNGEFGFFGKKGISLSVRLEPLTGFKFGNGGYWSRNFSTDRESSVKLPPTTKEKPFIFPAYRLGLPADLKNGFMQEFLIADNRLYQVRLAEKKITEDGVGDLEVTVWQKGVYGKAGTSWGISIKGGNKLQIQPTNDPFLYWAPSEGYQSSWFFLCADGEEGYSRERDFKFWVKQGDSYGSLSVECVAHFKGEFRLIVRSSQNNKPGDQNLQPVLPDWPLKEAPASK